MLFKENDAVRVKNDNPGATKRTPEYVRGKAGRILKVHGVIEGHAHDHVDFRGPAYSVIFDCAELFGAPSDGKVVVDLHENWLEPIPS